jgi:hypothetical protein
MIADLEMGRNNDTWRKILGGGTQLLLEASPAIVAALPSNPKYTYTCTILRLVWLSLPVMPYDTST